LHRADGSIALWVDIGTIGYFKDLQIIKKYKKAQKNLSLFSNTFSSSL